MPRTANPKPVIALALAGAILAAPALADTPATWSPTASEQLIKLPGDYLKKAVDNDFARSRLAAALVGLDRNIALKQQTLADLQAAIERADGELRTELQHQFLEEKRNYIDMMKKHQDLRARRANTKVRLYERLLSKLNRAQRAVTPQQADLLTKHPPPGSIPDCCRRRSRRKANMPANTPRTCRPSSPWCRPSNPTR